MKKEEQPIVPLREADITRSIAREFYKQFDELVQTDVIIVGGGPAGLVCARDLAMAGVRVLIVEQHTHLGGGFWSGGYLMTKASIAAPAHEILAEVGVPFQEVGPGHFMVEAPHACSKLIGAAFDAGAKVLNLTKVVDLVLRNEGQLEGVVVNWWPAESMGHDIVHVDPIALESRVVVDATGHDAVVLELLSKRKLFKEIPGNGAMWVERSEQMVMEYTGETYPNCYVIGLAVAAVYGTPRMGPAFGSMLLSGRKGARMILERLHAKAG